MITVNFYDGNTSHDLSTDVELVNFQEPFLIDVPEDITKDTLDILDTEIGGIIESLNKLDDKKTKSRLLSSLIKTLNNVFDLEARDLSDFKTKIAEIVSNGSPEDNDNTFSKMITEKENSNLFQTADYSLDESEVSGDENNDPV